MRTDKNGAIISTISGIATSKEVVQGITYIDIKSNGNRFDNSRRKYICTTKDPIMANAISIGDHVSIEYCSYRVWAGKSYLLAIDYKLLECFG